MMPNLDIAAETLSYLDYVEGETTMDKMLSFIAVHFATQLQACEREIRQYELKWVCFISVGVVAVENCQRIQGTD